MSSNELETDEAAELRIKERVSSAPDQPDLPEVVIQKSNPAQRVRKVVPTGRNGRMACAGGCGKQVLKALGECRKCRKARLRSGLKHILKMKKVPA